MARPRKPSIRDPRNNQIVHGLYFKKSNRSHYSIPSKGIEKYWGRDRVKAIDAFLASSRPEPLMQSYSDDDAIGDLLETGMSIEEIEDRPELVKQMKRGKFSGTDLKEWEKRIDDPFARSVVNECYKQMGRPLLPELPKDEAKVPVSDKRLKDCLKVWSDWKKDDGCDPGYIDDMQRCFGRFVTHVGNKRITELTADDFVKYEGWTIRQSKKRDDPNHWHNTQHKAVRSVLRLAKRKQPGWPFPAGLLEWTDQYDRKKYAPARHNRDPLPADIFGKLLAVCDKWAATDPNQFSSTSQRGRGQRLQALRKRRDGIQFAAILRIAANAALDNADCTRIEHRHLFLDGEIPYIDFPRIKPTRKVGQPIDRKTPLLSATVASLKAWIAHEPHVGPTIFRSARRRPFASNDLNDTFKRLRKEAGINEDWTFKHLRNIGPTIALRKNISGYLIDALLGHVIPTATRHYVGDLVPGDLSPLVKLIDSACFDVSATKDGNGSACVVSTHAETLAV